MSACRLLLLTAFFSVVIHSHLECFSFASTTAATDYCCDWRLEKKRRRRKRQRRPAAAAKVILRLWKRWMCVCEIESECIVIEWKYWNWQAGRQSDTTSSKAINRPSEETVHYCTTFFAVSNFCWSTDIFSTHQNWLIYQFFCLWFAEAANLSALLLKLSIVQLYHHFSLIFFIF